MLTGPQRDVIAVQHHREPFRLKRSAAVADPRGVDGRKGLAAPQRQRAAEQGRCFVRIRGRPCLRGQVSEQVQVYRMRLGRQGVAGGPAGDLQVWRIGQQRAQSRKIAREGVTGTVRRRGRPHPVDQLIDRHRPVDVDQQRREDTPLPRVADVEALSVHTSLDLAEQLEFRGHAVQRSPSARGVSIETPRSPANA